ncbi:MAG: IS3 family transposase [Microthrixaceae bacterium]|nr:IS3 family transposase [Microthrixaceae bacterium]
MIRIEAGMSTARFCALVDMPERTWRRWQANARAGRPVKGPWPRPVRDAVRDTVRRHALAHPGWGHRKVWAMTRHDGHRVSESTVLRLLRDEGLLLPAAYQRERRQLAQRRKAAFAVEPTGPNQMWQLDFSEFETTQGGTWRLAGCRDYFSKYEHPFHVSPTANQHDAIAAIEAALAEHEALFGHPLRDRCRVDETTGEVLPAVTIVTDNGGPFRSFRFEAFIAAHPELCHVRTRPERVPRTRVRHLEVRVAVPRRHRGRRRARRTSRRLPPRLQHDEAASGPRLEPARGGPPGPGQPHHPHL